LRSSSRRDQRRQWSRQTAGLRSASKGGRARRDRCRRRLVS
jgi:hypothetical protein